MQQSDKPHQLRIKVSCTPVPPATRSLEAEVKATWCPSAETVGVVPPNSACRPFGPTLTRIVVPVTRSRTKASLQPLVSSGTRFVAHESKLTNRPSSEIDPAKASS